MRIFLSPTLGRLREGWREGGGEGGKKQRGRRERGRVKTMERVHKEAKKDNRRSELAREMRKMAELLEHKPHIMQMNNADIVLQCINHAFKPTHY